MIGDALFLAGVAWTTTGLAVVIAFFFLGDEREVRTRDVLAAILGPFATVALIFVRHVRRRARLARQRAEFRLWKDRVKRQAGRR